MTVSWADPERRMLKRKFQEGGYVPGTYNHPEIPPGEEREVCLTTFAAMPGTCGLRPSVVRPIVLITFVCALRM